MQLVNRLYKCRMARGGCAHQAEQAAGEGRPEQQTCAQRMVHVLTKPLTRHRDRGLSSAPADDGRLHDQEPPKPAQPTSRAWAPHLVSVQALMQCLIKSAAQRLTLSSPAIACRCIGMSNGSSAHAVTPRCPTRLPHADTHTQRLRAPTQLPSQAQWWSNTETQRPQSWQCLHRRGCRMPHSSQKAPAPSAADFPTA